MSYKLRILSLGAGVQSSTILLMACKGELPKPDAAIFADTGWETAVTYMHLEWLKIEAGKHGIPVIVVDSGNLKDKLLESHNFIGPCDKKRMGSIPFFTKQTNGNVGMLRRQCTADHKIVPIKKQIRKMLGLKPKQWAPKDCVEQWIGISTDEAQRMFTRKRDRMAVMRFPLLEWKPMSRMDCMKWLHENYNIVVPKSSCVGCPYHSQNEWRNLSSNEFTDACNFDEATRRKGGIRGDLFLHRSCMPLSEVDLRTPEERGQQIFDFYKNDKLNLFLNNISIHSNDMGEYVI
ncbi:MAG: hypothetical protein Q7J27_00530 [Syntrophales bacterium]|nr:hypothetical protein [Syntrophales bacterium]